MVHQLNDKGTRKRRCKVGIVLGHKPVKAREMADVFAVSEKTVRRWLEVLEQHEYIKTVRAPYGLIVSVKHSKRFTPKRH